jgi:hypothetical protein
MMQMMDTIVIQVLFFSSQFLCSSVCSGLMTGSGTTSGSTGVGPGSGVGVGLGGFGSGMGSSLSALAVSSPDFSVVMRFLFLGPRPILM